MKKSCVAIRHIYFEDLGTFEKPIQEAGYEINYIDVADHGLKAIKDADLLVFLGGPIGVNEKDDYNFLNDEITLAQYRLEYKKPTLGICLGAQVIAAAAGAKVYPGQQGVELGWKPLQLTKEGQSSVVASLVTDNTYLFHWHGDTFDLPEGATLLASSDQYAHQIYSIDDNVLAFQCHPELEASRIEHWLIGHAYELGKTVNTDLNLIRDETRLYGESLSKHANLMMQRWLGTI